MKFKDFNFFWVFATFFHGLTPLKPKNFDKNLNLSNNTQNFSHGSSLECLINTSLHHTMKFKDFNFVLGFRHFFRGLTPLKPKNFDKNLNISNNTQKFSHSS